MEDDSTGKSPQRKVRIDESVESLELDLSVERIIPVIGTDKTSIVRNYVLKVTAKHGAVLV